jgi:hypothetical protein
VLLADTSVWISHLHRSDERLATALEAGQVLIHPFVIGELACGSMRRREAMLDDLGRLPSATTASHKEALHLVERYRLSGRGIGWIDAHLLASALLSDADLYTHDTALRAAWARIR